MKKKLIQLSQIIDKEPKSLGFLGITRKKFKIDKTYILVHKRGTNKQYTKEFYIAKCVGIFDNQYLFELVNDGI
jgi:hypothetical protein